MLTSRFSMWMAWGEDLTFFCNDAYRRDTLGVKHPWALGRSAREVWAEIWDDIGPRIDSVFRDGVSTWDEALMLFLERSGYREETYHTFSYSPLVDDDNMIAGMLCVVVEETERVLSERRLATLGELSAAARGAESEDDVYATLPPRVPPGRPGPHVRCPRVDADDGRVPCGRRPMGSTPAPRPRRAWRSTASEGAGGASAGSTSAPASGTAGLPAGPWEDVAEHAVVLPLPRAVAGGPSEASSGTCLVVGPQPVPAARGDGRVASPASWRCRSRRRWGPCARRSRTSAGRRPRGARPRQDPVLRQREPRVPHAADAHHGTAGGRCAIAPTSAWTPTRRGSCR